MSLISDPGRVRAQTGQEVGPLLGCVDSVDMSFLLQLDAGSAACSSAALVTDLAVAMYANEWSLQRRILEIQHGYYVFQSRSCPAKKETS